MQLQPETTTTAKGLSTAALFSSATDDWPTPQGFFDRLDTAFGFELDVYASDARHKCDRYFTAEQDGLPPEWTGTVWMNPPYDLGIIGPWVQETFEFGKAGATVDCLLPRAPTPAGGRQTTARAGKSTLCAGACASATRQAAPRSPAQLLSSAPPSRTHSPPESMPNPQHGAHCWLRVLRLVLAIMEDS
jgi:site-specific DNA-methyltransferase (adenine-specific)